MIIVSCRFPLCWEAELMETPQIDLHPLPSGQSFPLCWEAELMETLEQSLSCHRCLSSFPPRWEAELIETLKLVGGQCPPY